MFSKLDNDLAFVQSALNVRAQRQTLLAANIANADTPNYKARDLDFAAAMRGAMGSGPGGIQMARTSDRHLGGVGGGANTAGALRYRSAVQPSLDGNTVDPDVERAHFTDNALHYQFLLERASSTLRNVSSVLSQAK